jgi:hypothetical protein
VTGSEITAARFMVLASGFCGWLGLFKTKMLVGWAGCTHRRNRMSRACPFSGLSLKPWYPAYLGCMGVLIWWFGTATVGMLIFAAVRH